MTISFIVLATLLSKPAEVKRETAVLGGGCFWCVEAIYERVRGVESVISGYTGGWKKNPTYKDISSKNTGHVETVLITFDPKIVTYEQILNIFFSTHDPTTPNRQGNDIGPQYSSVIFYQNPLQKKIATKVKLSSARLWENPIVTDILALDIFYPAENYHQDYFQKNPTKGYCTVVINPKVQKFKKNFKHLLKKAY